MTPPAASASMAGVATSAWRAQQSKGVSGEQAAPFARARERESQGESGRERDAHAGVSEVSVAQIIGQQDQYLLQQGQSTLESLCRSLLSACLLFEAGSRARVSVVGVCTCTCVVSEDDGSASASSHHSAAQREPISSSELRTWLNGSLARARSTRRSAAAASSAMR
eukprot:COSAG03_NODE_3239_length_2127_cov_196.391026_2_plen_167_part_00